MRRRSFLRSLAAATMIHPALRWHHGLTFEAPGVRFYYLATNCLGDFDEPVRSGTGALEDPWMSLAKAAMATRRDDVFHVRTYRLT